MFDWLGLGGMAGLDDQALASAALTAVRHQQESDASVLLISALWADSHGPVPVDPGSKVFPGMERAVRMGGPGTPEVMEFAGAELAGYFQLAAHAGTKLMADALDLRHRFPLIWSRIKQGEVRTYKARRAAVLSRGLSVEQCAALDEVLVEPLTSLSDGQFFTLLEAKLIEVDPEGEGRRLKKEWCQRIVHVGQKNAVGLKTIFARCAASDALLFDAMVDRLADILVEQGATGGRDVLRSRAIGILARPHLALQLLAGVVDQPLPGLEDPLAGASDGGNPLWISEIGAVDATTDDPALAEDEDCTQVAECDMEPWDRDADPPATPPVPADSDRLVEAIKTINPTKLMPPVTLHVHLAEETIKAGQGVVRMEDASPFTLELLLTMLRDTGCVVKIQPVIDPRDATPVTSYEVPQRMRQQLLYRHPVEVCPWGSETRRSRLDMDHTNPYVPPDRGGPPGQTNLGNVGPLGRSWHRLATFGQWSRRQPSPGTLIWRDPLGYFYLHNYAGTHSLGKDTFAQKIWAAAAPKRAKKS